MNAKQRIKVDTAYLEAHNKAQGLVEKIGELLFDMPAPDNDEDPIHWGHVGDLNHINSQLADIVSFLDGTRQ